ncbi:MAG: TetR family transcriptional regulator, partial [Clostridia bacterium]|nr:TetR family transcriptional regulator [Clostridia bacterium]
MHAVRGRLPGQSRASPQINPESIVRRITVPKKPRSEQEVQKVREEILDKTLELINEVGYENFTMRKLANKLN